jgi:hypothetical protein
MEIKSTTATATPGVNTNTARAGLRPAPVIIGALLALFVIAALAIVVF